MFDYYKGSGMPESDLACERRRADTSMPGIDFRREDKNGFSWEKLRIISNEAAKEIGRPVGNYDTLTIPKMCMLDEEEIFDAANEIAKELCLALDRIEACPDRILVAGLGNPELTPDSVGPKVASMINATMHIKNYDRRMFCDLECSEIAVCSPGVMAKTGMEAAEIIMSVCDRIAPDVVIAVDSLASRSPKRLGTTIQISDTGIFPGSGIGNTRRPLCFDTVGAPVIAIGVPTVINARILTGAQGNSEFDGDLFVSPREIDTVTHISSKIIAEGINQAFGIF